MYSRLKTRKFRSLILELLERRELFAFDLTDVSNHLTMGVHDSNDQLAYSPPSAPAIDFKSIKNATPQTIDPSLQSNAEIAIAFSKQNLAPVSAIRVFRESIPSLSQIQPTLVGANLASEIDWEKLQKRNSTDKLSLSVTDAAQATQLMSNGIGSLRTSNARSMGQNSDSISAGSFCREDGSMVLAIASTPEAEGPATGNSGGSSGSNLLIPQLNLPDLELYRPVGGDIDSYAPIDPTSSTAISVFGSFTPASLDNPDYDTSGMNWVHSFTTNWVSLTQWSITERFVCAFNLANSESDSGNNAGGNNVAGNNAPGNNMPGSNGSSSSGQDSGQTVPGLNESSSWSSSISVTRSGFMILVFHASRGISTPAAAGVQSDFNLRFNDAVQINAGANGSATYTPSAPITTGSTTSGSLEDTLASPDYPSDFAGQSAWSATIILTASLGGTVVMSSTPSIDASGTVNKAVSADVSYDVGGNVVETSGWSASSHSGSLSLPFYPNNGNPNPLLGCDVDHAISDAASAFGGASDTPIDDLPHGPVGPVVGSGSASLDSGTNESKLGGTLKGGWNLQGVLNDSGWSSVTGGAVAALHGTTGGKDKSNHFFVYQTGPVVVASPDGTTTTTNVSLISVGYYGGGLNELANAQSGNPSSNYLYVQERNADFNAQLTETTSLPLNSATVTTTITRSGDPHVVAWSTGAGNQELANSFESHLEAIITGISPPELQNWSGTAGSIVSQKPSTSYLMEAISWFGGTAGDSADRAMNFTTGVGDAMSCNLGYGIRSSLGIDYTNYDGDYNGGQIVGTVAGVVTGGPALVKGAAQGAKAIASGAQNLTKCGTALGKLIRNSCFVAGTLVNLSSLPRDLESESNLWSNDDWDMRSNEEDGTSTTSVLRFSAIAAPSRILIPIEQVPLGARVPTKNPRPWEYDDSLPDPMREQWARIELTYEGDDGRITDIELLRPRTWVQSNEVFPNATVFINMPELKVKGLAYVRAIEACPVIADGSGSVVTARFATRSVDMIASVEIMGADGAIEVIEGTPNHPFWSLDRNDWVPLGELEEGEHLQGEAGVAFVLTHVIVNRSVPVYNIEVHGEHVYQVGELGFLVHNACPAPIEAATTGGRAITSHATESLARHGFKPPFGAIDEIIKQAQWTAKQADGAIVHILKQPGRGRSYSIVVEGVQGTVTAMKDLSPKALGNLARNYGFGLPW